jgi:hypothetical protein
MKAVKNEKAKTVLKKKFKKRKLLHSSVLQVCVETGASPVHFEASTVTEIATLLQ